MSRGPRLYITWSCYLEIRPDFRVVKRPPTPFTRTTPPRERTPTPVERPLCVVGSGPPTSLSNYTLCFLSGHEGSLPDLEYRGPHLVVET